MQRLLTLSPLVLALSLHAGQAMALGFGTVSGATALGHPLAFSVGVRLEGDEAPEPDCIGADVLVGDRPLAPEAVTVRLTRPGPRGEQRIRVATAVAIEEPTVSITVRVGCPPRLSRTFTVFADPPHTVPRIGDPLADALESEPRRSPVAPAARPSPTPRASTSAAAASDPAPGTSPKAPVAARRGRAPAAEAGRPARPVLQLDPVEADERAEPTLRMSTSLGTAVAPPRAASSPPDADEVRRVQDLDRLQALEASVQALRADGLAKDRAIAALEVEARRAGALPDAQRWLTVLSALCAALAVALAVVVWLRRRDRARAAWWGLAPATDEAAAPAADTGAPEAEADRPPAAGREPSVLPAPAPAAVPRPLAAEPAAPMFALRAEAGTEPTAAEPRRPMSAEELIDLEQQVEFFVVLGQDDAAIDLLMGHVRSTSGVSPLPYLKLLEIYRRREEREPYERIRERFNRRFNAYAPEWGVDPETGFDLEGYPDVLGRVQGIWPMPSMAMELLDTQLFRRDAGPTFDVPAYRELLFLYGIARDLAERDVPASGVDLLLPLGEDDPAPGGGPIVALSSEADAASAPLPELDRLHLDLDVSTGQPPDLAVELPADSERGRGLDFHLDDDPQPPQSRR